MIAVSSSFGAPFLIKSLRDGVYHDILCTIQMHEVYLNDVSAFPKRHTFKFPSAVSLKRLHEPQKCSDIDVIKPIFPR